MFPLETPRLLIRPLTNGDLEAIHAIFGDPEVMARVPKGPSPDLAHSKERLDSLIEHQDRHGFSLWAVTERSSGELIGDCGLMYVEGEGPDVELAYHLRRDRWGKGYVTEAAKECIRFGLKELRIPRIVALAEPLHFVSRRVMEKVGMSHEGDEERYGKRMAVYSISGLDSTA